MIKPIAPIALIIVMVIASCGKAPDVAQGTVINFNPETKILVLKNDSPPYQELPLSLQTADYGSEPAVGDIVRVAYRDEGGRLVALRVMALSKQKETTKQKH